MLCCTAGGWKLQVYIVFICKTLPAGEVLPKNNIIPAHENGWMNSAAVKQWVKTVWQCHPGALLSKESGVTASSGLTP